MLPHLVLEGPPRRQGQTHGEAARARIQHNLALYFDRFEREGRLRPDAVLERAARYWPVIQAQDPDYAAALEGVAEGAGAALLEVVALNVRYEILYHQFAAIAMADGCSAFALLPERTAEGHLVLGQNWDWIPDVKGVVLETRGTAMDCLAFSEAGIVGGKIGLNAAGLGLAINGLMSSDDDWARLGVPFHVRCHQILQRGSLAEAEALALAEPRSCSANYLIGQVPGEVVDLETAPTAARRLGAEGGAALHTNHFLDPDGMGVIEPREDTIPRSIHRYARCQVLFRGGETLSLAEVQERLRDHVGHPRQSLCRHQDPTIAPEECYETITSVVMDLDSRTLWATDGPPCTAPYQAFTLAGAAP